MKILLLALALAHVSGYHSPRRRPMSRAKACLRNLTMLEMWRGSLGLGGVKKWRLHWRDAL